MKASFLFLFATLGGYWQGLSQVKKGVVLALFFVSFGFMIGSKFTALQSLPQDNAARIAEIEEQTKEQEQDINQLRSEFRSFQRNTDEKLEAVLRMISNEICRSRGTPARQCDWREMSRQIHESRGQEDR